MKIALVSLDQAWEDKISNRIECEKFIRKASECKVALIVFPEMTLTGFSMNTKLIGENPDNSPTINFFSQLAISFNISIAFGIVFLQKEKATNNLIIVDNTGAVIANYAKIHPFSFTGEDKFYMSGDKLITCVLNEASIGLTICYDLRFPEIYQALSKECNLIINIANWPERRVNHWISLTQARAIENQCFMVGVNRTGTDGKNLNYTKSSAVFNPNGDQIYSEYTFETMDIFEIELNTVKLLRDSFPVKSDRKIDYYKSIL